MGWRAGFLLLLLRVAARLLAYLRRRAALSAADAAVTAQVARRIAQQAAEAARIEETVAGMDEQTVREELTRHGDFRD